MARRTRRFSRSRRSFRPRTTTRRRATRGATRRSTQRVELVIRQEGPQAIAGGMPQMVLDGGKLKMQGQGPREAKF